jgi:hypothetical protein
MSIDLVLVRVLDIAVMERYFVRIKQLTVVAAHKKPYNSQ